MTNANPDSNNTVSPPTTLQIDWIDLRVRPDQHLHPFRFCLLVTASDEIEFLYLEYFPNCTPENLYLGLARARKAWANAPEQSAGLAIMPCSSLALLRSLEKTCVSQKEV
jgi:hypothetical protein